jgi:hypothetical protein
MTILFMISILSPSPEPPCDRASPVELARGVRVIAALEHDGDARAACVAPFSLERLEWADDADAQD